MSTPQITQSAQSTQPCEHFRKHGSCRKSCPYSHQPPKNASSNPKAAGPRSKKKPVKYSSFVYDDSQPVMSEFYRMCDWFGWEKDDEERKEARDRLKDALVQEFNAIYGTDPNSLAAWKSLCLVLNLDNIPNELQACRQLVKSVHVNIVDLVDTPVTQQPVIHFSSEETLADYTRLTGKYFPRESAYAGGLLRPVEDLLFTMTNQPLLSARNLSVLKDKDTAIFSDVSFDLHEGDILVLQGRSGGGKTTILKALAQLNVCKGDVRFHGEAPSKYGIPTYRTKVLYVPQRPSMLPSTPRHFLTTINEFSSRAVHKERPQNSTFGTASQEHRPDEDRTQLETGPHDPFQIAKEWGLSDDVWSREWATLSGGEAQRVLLAIACGLRGTEILLLDDSETSALVEKTLTGLPKSSSSIKAIVWITHSHDQSERVGTRWINVTGHGIEESDSSAYHNQNGTP
ncbi:ABC transporter [Rhizoctonia solani]|uniref:ABC transporter n=1 Tax=Rhizoctonia solani TaxID=456999 RepID=A0A8H8PBK8_9AGAM|nr:ABC transporter [Rhizoctonia solani]QRW27727.1 ABC transporter [Rhizoctonia solani]